MGGNGESGNWTYGDYLRLHELLELQGDERGISADEMHANVEKLKQAMQNLGEE